MTYTNVLDTLRNSLQRKTFVPEELEERDRFTPTEEETEESETTEEGD